MLDTLLSLSDHKHKLFYLSAVILSLAGIVHMYAPLFLLVGAAGVYFVYKYSYKAIMVLVISSYFIVTSDLSESLRVIVNYIGLVILGGVYIFKFGISLKPLKHIPDSFNLFVLSCLFIMILGSLLASSYAYSAIYIFKQIIFFFICYVILSLIKEKEYLMLLKHIVLGVGVILSVSVLYEVSSILYNFTNLLQAGEFRFSGLYGNPNSVALFLAVSLPLGFSEIYASENKNYKQFMIGLVALMGVALIFTNSRAATGGVFISLAYFILHFNKKLFYKLLVGLLVIVLLVLIIDPARELFLMIIRFERIFENIRGYYWLIGMDIIRDHPITGVGPGMFINYIYTYLPVKMGTFDQFQIEIAKSGTTHNFYLFRQVEMGILGTLNTIYFLFLFFYITNKTIKLLDYRSKGYYLILGIKSIGIGLFCRGLLETTGLITHGWITRDMPFWIVFMIAVTMYVSVKSGKEKYIE